MNNEAYHHLLDLLNFDNKEIIDIGFGTGWLEEKYLLSAKSILALDKNAEAVEQMQRCWPVDAPTANFLIADIITYNPQPSSADIALFLDSL